VPNNYKLAPLLGIEQVSPIPASVSFSRNFSLLVPTHPIFNGITDPYTAWYSSCVQGMNVTLATKIAESTDHLGYISTYIGPTYSSVYFSHLPENKGNAIPEDRLVVYNAIVWASVERGPPVADAGPDQTVDEDELVIFDGSGSSDNTGFVADYKWAFTDKTPKTLPGVSPSYIFSTPGTYTVTLTVKDAAGNSATDTVVITVSDVTNPVADAGIDQKVKVKKTVTFNAGNSSDNAGIVSYEWDFGDGTTGTGVIANHTYKKAGTYTVTLTVKDAFGNSATDTVVIKVQAAAGFPLWALVPIIGIIGVVAVVVYLKKRKPKEKVPKPAKLGITAEPTAILADGEATSTITIELLDKKGKPVSALADTEVGLTSTGGKIEKPVVRIPKGKETEKTVLISSKEVGSVTLKADVKGLKSASISLAFVEKKRYCMHCGTKMPFTARHCPKCGKAPPAGVDTKACKNCKAVIPIVAKFCAECGASQPE
jgi:PKD repeat protein